MANRYSYINKSGQNAFIDAETPDEAISRATDRMSNSGVQLEKPVTAPAPAMGGQDAPKTSSSTITVNRTPGLLDKAKEDAIITEKKLKKMQRDADRYAAQMRQARIDAINTAFAPRLEREKEEGDARLARINALNFKKGITDSGADTTAVNAQKTANEKVIRGIEDEKAILINEAFGYADTLRKERLAEDQKNNKELAEGNVARYQQKTDLALKSLQSFGNAGISLDEIKTADPETYKTLKDIGGLTDFDMVTALNQSNPKMNAKLEFQNGVVYQYYTDPKTGDVKIVSQRAPDDVPDNYKPQFAPDGTLLFLPEKFDPKKSVSEQVIRGGTYRKPEEPKDPKKFFEFTGTQKTKLLAAGLDRESATALEEFLQTNSIDDALEQMEEGGQPLTEAQRKRIRAAVTGDESGA